MPAFRRRFDHFHAEFSVRVGNLLPRYPLWLSIHELGFDPDTASAHDLVDFLDFSAPSFLWDHLGLRLSERQWRRMRRATLRFDPERRQPDDVLGALAG